jgi:outer membrane protein OmpA-like peptidoglycan-associated protein
MKPCTFFRSIIATIGLLLIFVVTAYSQEYQRNKKRYYKEAYGRSTASITHACRIVKKSMSTTKNRRVRNTGGSWQNYRPQAETDRPVASIKSTPKAAPVAARAEPVQKPTPKAAPSITPTGKPMFTPTPIVSKSVLEQLHSKEDEVLKLNHLPTPTSEKHEEIRRLVSNTLAKKTDNEPIELEPLYFTFDQDEFAVVDMDPFLIAVEFALQGKHILIEGHTDHEGADNYNVQLSIKRVQKIRQLMIDMGVSDDQISVVGYGEEVTDHADKTEDGKQQNRRVDFRAF